MQTDNLDFTRFTMSYSGSRADSGTLDARAFGLSAIGLADLFTGVAEECHASRPSLRIKGEIVRGSVIAHYAVAMLPTVTGFLRNNEDLLLSTAALLEIVARGNWFIGNVKAGVLQLRQAFADSITAEARAQEAENQQQPARKRDRKGSETIAQRYSNALAFRNGARDRYLEDIARFAMSADGQRALQRALGPLIDSEATVMEMSFNHVSVRLSTDQLTDLRNTLVERAAAAGVARPSLPSALDEKLDAVEASVEVLTAQLDGRRTGWRLRMDDKTISATIYDDEFLAAAKANSIEMSGRVFKVVLRKRSELASRAYDVLKVLG